MVYNLCLNYLQNKEDAEEVFQDVFLSVHQNLNKFENRSEFKTWIYRIAINKSIDFLKAKKTKKRWAFFRMTNLDDLSLPSKVDHPGILLESKEATGHIFSAINLLPNNQKTALVLKTMEQLTQKEISKVLGVSEKAVESLLSRARRNLKEVLSKKKDRF